MKLASALLIAMCAVVAAAVVHAQTGPTARRVYLLCESEDPSCPALIQKAYNEFLANPTVTECYSVNYGNGTYDAKRGCWNTTNTCHLLNTRMKLDDIYLRYMQIFTQARMYWESSPRVMMYVAMNMSGLCAGP